MKILGTVHVKTIIDVIFSVTDAHVYIIFICYQKKKKENYSKHNLVDSNQFKTTVNRFYKCKKKKILLLTLHYLFKKLLLVK